MVVFYLDCKAKIFLIILYFFFNNEIDCSKIDSTTNLVRIKFRNSYFFVERFLLLSQKGKYLWSIEHQANSKILVKA